MKIHYYHRNQKTGFSIYVVFKTIISEIEKYVYYTETYLPSCAAGLKDIVQNGLAARKKQKNGYINHVTGDVHYLAYFLDSKRTIVTVHDIMYYNYLSGLKKILWKWLYILPLRKARFVTFISEFAKQQVLSVISIPEDRIFVIPNPVSERFVFKPKEFNEDKPVILHIGTLERKNLLRTIMALKGLSCHLRIVGTITRDIKESLSKHNVEFSNVENLSDEEIVREYTDCDIVNFPSTFEGFGMPIIEGQATGRIVVTSDMSPMKDVAGNGAVLVDPYSVNSIRNAYISIIKDISMRKSLIEKGQENVKSYMTSVIAQRYLEVYNRVKL